MFQPSDHLVIEAEDPPQLLFVGGDTESVLEEGQLVQVVPLARQLGDQAQFLGADSAQDLPETTAWRAYSERVRLQAFALRCTRRYSASPTRKRTVRERKVAVLFRGRPPLGFVTSMAWECWRWNK